MARASACGYVVVEGGGERQRPQGCPLVSSECNSTDLLLIHSRVIQRCEQFERR